MVVVAAERHLSPEGLRDLLAIVNSSRGLDEILSYLVVQAQHVLGADAAALYLRGEAHADVLEVKAAHGIPHDLVKETVSVGEPIIGLSVSLQRIVEGQLEEHGAFLDAVRPGPLSEHDPDLQRRNRRFAEHYATIAAIPLAARDETYGALVLYHAELRRIDERQVDLGLAFAQQAALAIENAKLRAQAEQRLSEIVRRQHVAEGLRDLLAVVNSNHDLDEILDEVLAQSGRLLGNDAGAVYLRANEDAEILRVRAAHGLEQGELALELRVGSPTTGLAVRQGRTLVC